VVSRTGPTVPHTKQRITTLPPSATGSVIRGPLLCSHVSAVGLFRVPSLRGSPKALTKLLPRNGYYCRCSQGAGRMYIRQMAYIRRLCGLCLPYPIRPVRCRRTHQEMEPSAKSLRRDSLCVYTTIRTRERVRPGGPGSPRPGLSHEKALRSGEPMRSRGERRAYKFHYRTVAIVGAAQK
jgi:hypothetical protein